ncbi:nicotinamide-nucleotide amidohydrolase family protein [Ruminococcaceae bacterium OttesenSCG-928-N02]|nr:nicotinamide-nucleotide amidohydrolase family protein [Ruminococcaceae bacterium OttesenSCG-928-N02]
MMDTVLSCTAQRCVNLFGLEAKQVYTLAGPLLQGDNPSVKVWQNKGELQIRIEAQAQSEGEAQAVCDARVQALTAALGDYAYSTGESLAEVVVHAMQAQDARLATAESCTGGLLSSRITQVPGASDVFEFGITAYAGYVKREALGVTKRSLRKHGEVSAQVAAEMAFGVAKEGDAHFGVGITGVAGPGGGTPERPVGLVYIAVCDEKAVYIMQMNAPGATRDEVRYLATQHALDMLRRLATGLPLPQTKRFKKNERVDFERHAAPKKKGGALRVALLVLILAALCGAGYYFWPTLRTYLPGYALAAGRYTSGIQPGSASYEQDMMRMVASLQNENENVRGWITIEGLGISYPVVQAADNEYYKTHTYSGQENTAGAIYADANSQADEPAAGNLVLYGAANKHLFGPLETFKTLRGVRTGGQITYFTGDSYTHYDLLCVYYMDTSDTAGFDFTALQREGFTAEEFSEFIVQSKMRSLYETPYDVSHEDALITLCVPDDFSPTGYLIVLARAAQENTLGFDPACIQLAHSSLCPASYYENVGGNAPDAETLHTRWLGWYQDQGTTNGGLQNALGMPSEDTPLDNLLAEQGQDSSSSTSGSGGPSGSVSGSSSTSGSSSVSSGGSSVSSSNSGSSSSSRPPSSSSRPPSSSSAPASSSSNAPAPSSSPAADVEMLTVTMNGVRTTGTAQDILSQIVAMEMSTNFQVEALRAQTVAAHTWILSQQASGNSAPSVSGRAASAKVQEAVASVLNEVLTYGGAVAFTPYGAMNTGTTNSSQDAWGGVRPYLVPVESRYDSTVASYKTTVVFTAQQIADAVQTALNHTLDMEGDHSTWFGDIQRNAGGYVTSLRIGSITVSGTKVWQGVLKKPNGTAALRSAAFEIAYDDSADTFTFTVYGYGHGVGMSQWGAQLYALNDGWSYSQILLHYYPGVSITNLY